MQACLVTIFTLSDCFLQILALASCAESDAAMILHCIMQASDKFKEPAIGEGGGIEEEIYADDDEEDDYYENEEDEGVYQNDEDAGVDDGEGGDA